MTSAALAKEIRDNLAFAKKSDRHNRDACRDNLKFLNGDQWEAQEAEKRRNKRLMLTTDLLNAPVDQVVNSVKQNRPGPDVSPSGEGTDKLDAENMAGIMRRVDYENRSWIAFSTAMEYATGGNFGCWEMDVDWADTRSWRRKIIVKPIPNANETVYFDPCAMQKDRSDAMWAIQLSVMNLELYKSKFPKSTAATRGPMKGIIDWFSTFRDDSFNGWVTEAGIQLAKYWKFEVENDTLRLYSNGVAYYDTEKATIPAFDAYNQPVEVDNSQPSRTVENKKLKWYLCNGAEILKEGDWEGYWIPLFPVYGRERWVENKRWIFSMIQLAKQAQQAFNFSFTSACETLSTVAKAPFIGLLGQFKSKFAQWQKANRELQAYLEYDEVILSNGVPHTAPPQRNVNEPPIQAFLAFCQLAINVIQRTTSVFDPSLGRQKSDQSGKAVQLLDEQSMEGNYHWSDNLNIALTHYYRALGDLIQKEYDAPQVIQIMRADNTPDAVRINQVFKGKDGQDRHNKIAAGNFAYTISTGPSYINQRKADVAKIDGLIKVLPPQMVAEAADLIAKIHDLGPLGDQIADRWIPPQYRDADDPQGAAQKLAQAMQENQLLHKVVQKLQQVLESKQPQLEVEKYKAELSALTSIRVAQEKNKNDQAQRDADALETMLNLSHSAADGEANRVTQMQISQDQLAANQETGNNQTGDTQE